MEMTDGAHVPCVDREGGVRRFIWDLPHGQVLIDVHPDGRVQVNGRDVETAGAARKVHRASVVNR